MEEIWQFMQEQWDDVISAVHDIFLSMGSKCCNTNGKAVWTAKEDYEAGALKSSFDNVISAVDDFFYQWDPITAT